MTRTGQNPRDDQSRLLRQNQREIEHEFVWQVRDNREIRVTARSGFGSAASDKIIEEIRSTRDVARRNDLYQQLQQIIYDEQPVIFLFVPTERIAMTGKWKPVISINRPGFFEQYFQ